MAEFDLFSDCDIIETVKRKEQETMLVNLIFAAILTFLVFCCVCAIANVFANSKRPLVSLEDKKHHFHERIFYFIVFVVLAVMIGVLVFCVMPMYWR